MTASRTTLRLASAGAAVAAVTAISLTAMVLPDLARADHDTKTGKPAASATRPSQIGKPNPPRRTLKPIFPSRSATPTATAPSTPAATTPRTPKATPPRMPKATTAPRTTAPTANPPTVDTTNAPGSTVSFGPEQEWTVLDPRFNKDQLNLLAGESFVMYADVLHSQPLEQDLSIKLSKLDNLTCEATDDTVPAGSDAGLQTFVVECVVTRGKTRVSGLYQLVQADGSVIGEGVFGASPNPDAGPSSTAKATPDARATTTAKPTNSATPTKADIEIATARFTPTSFPVREGQRFRVDKDVTITNAPLHSALTMTIDREQNLDCNPQAASVAKGAEGTNTLTFNCVITGTDRAPGAWYSIKLADGTVLVDDGYFGLDANRAGVTETKPGTHRDTSGGLADTGAPALGAVLAAGLAGVTAGAVLLIRRRRNG